MKLRGLLKNSQAASEGKGPDEKALAQELLQAFRDMPSWMKATIGATSTFQAFTHPIGIHQSAVRPDAAFPIAPMPRDGLIAGVAHQTAQIRNVRLAPPFDSGKNFRLGANLPWANYGQDFGSCKWGEGLARNPAAAKKYDDAFALMKKSNVTTARIFVLCDGRAGIDFDKSGMPQGLSKTPDGKTPVLEDLDTALAIAKKHGISLHLSLLDFHMFLPAKKVDGLQLGGRGPVLESPEGRRRFIDNVLKPMVQHMASGSKHARLPNGKPTVEAIEIINEPDWVTKGIGASKSTTVSPNAMRAFISEARDMCHKVAPSQFVTVGSAHASQKSLGLVKGLGLDFYQAHWYPSHDDAAGKGLLHTSVKNFKLDKPLVLGEFPSQGFEKNCSTGVAGLANQARKSGYGGAFCWSILATDEFSASHASAKPGRPETLLQEMVTVASK